MRSETKKRRRRSPLPFAAWPSFDVTCISKHRPFSNRGGLLFVAANDRAAYRELARLGWRFQRGKGWLCPRHATTTPERPRDAGKETR